MPPIIDQAEQALLALKLANREFNVTYPGPSAHRQPVHTVYGGAHLFRWDTSIRLGQAARQTFASYGSDPLRFARGIGLQGASLARALRRGKPNSCRLASNETPRGCGESSRRRGSPLPSTSGC